MSNNDKKLKQLRLLMLIQAVAFCIYGIQWYILPEFTLITIGGFNAIPNHFWLRIIGSSFFAFAFLEYMTAKSISELSVRLDLVWGFVLIPALFLVTLFLHFSYVYSYPVFFWLNIIVILFFLVVISLLRIRITQ